MSRYRNAMASNRGKKRTVQGSRYRDESRRQADAGYRSESRRYRGSDYREKDRNARSAGYRTAKGSSLRGTGYRTEGRGSHNMGYREDGQNTRSAGYRQERRRPEERSGNTGNRQRQAKGRKRRRKKHFLIRLIVRLLLLVVLIAVLSVFYLVSKLDDIENHELENVVTNKFTDSNMDEYRQIAIFGVDSRANDLTKNTRSDSIMVASINKKTHDVNIISIYRDTYVKIKDHGYTKVNHAYAYGGPDLAVNTLNRNFDLNIKDFVTINFSALSNVVDALGGIELDITKEERKWVNAYAKDVAKINGEKYTKIKKPGKQTVTGVQATAYCRVRKTKGGDYTRAGRQRTVLNAIFDKVKHSNPVKLIDIMNEMLPQIYTSLDTSEMLDLAKYMPFYEITGQEGFPYEQESHRASDGIYYDFPVTLHENVVELHEKLFGTKDFVPSGTVEKISQEITVRR